MWDISKLYQEHWGFLCKYLSARFGSGPPDPNDIAQDAFLKLSDQLKQNNLIQNPKAFLTKTACNLVIDYHRSPKNRLANEDERAKVNDKGSDVYAPENVLINKEAMGILTDVMMTLSERDRAFVLMNRLEGLTYTEIAKKANMSRSGVQLIITNALKKCMDELQRVGSISTLSG